MYGFYLLLVFCVVAGTMFLYVGIPFLYGRYVRANMIKKGMCAGKVALTFDDGPGRRTTEAVLQTLKEFNAKGTFFLLGRNVAGNGDIVKRMAAAGHDICSHGYEHLDYWRVSPSRAIGDIKRSWQAIGEVLGETCYVCPFRPPYGRLNLAALLYLLYFRVPIVPWTADIEDRVTSQDGILKNDDAHRIVNRIRDLGGAVVLAHDSDRRNRDTEAFTLRVVRAVLESAKATDMQVVTVAELALSKQASK